MRKRSTFEVTLLSISRRTGAKGLLALSTALHNRSLPCPPSQNSFSSRSLDASEPSRRAREWLRIPPPNPQEAPCTMSARRPPKSETPSKARRPWISALNNKAGSAPQWHPSLEEAELCQLNLCTTMPTRFTFLDDRQWCSSF